MRKRRGYTAEQIRQMTDGKSSRYSCTGTVTLVDGEDVRHFVKGPNLLDEPDLARAILGDKVYEAILEAADNPRGTVVVTSIDRKAKTLTFGASPRPGTEDE